jgi:hypothetical protein
LPLRRRLALRDARHAGHAQPGLAGGLRKRLADAVIDDLVLHRIAVALRHDRHRHLAGPKTIGLDRARQALETCLYLAMNRLRGHVQRDAALELV